MAKFAVVNPTGGVVSNTIVADNKETAEKYVGTCVEITEATGVASPGYTWDGTVFTPPTT